MKDGVVQRSFVQQNRYSKRVLPNVVDLWRLGWPQPHRDRCMNHASFKTTHYASLEPAIERQRRRDGANVMPPSLRDEENVARPEDGVKCLRLSKERVRSEVGALNVNG